MIQIIDPTKLERNKINFKDEIFVHKRSEIRKKKFVSKSFMVITSLIIMIDNATFQNLKSLFIMILHYY